MPNESITTKQSLEDTRKLLFRRIEEHEKYISAYRKSIELIEQELRVIS